MIGLLYFALEQDEAGIRYLVCDWCLNDDDARARWPDAIRIEDEHGRVLVIPPQRRAA